MTVHRIETGNSFPIKSRTRRFGPKESLVIENHVEELLKLGKIRYSNSPWRANIVLVPKKDGSTRVCVDYRALNQVTKKDAQSLHFIDDLLDRFAGMTCFTTLDLFSGYWQIGMDPDSAEKTAFGTSKGHFEYTVMPFGLCNAPSTFQRTMETILQSVIYRCAVVYLDDITIYSKDPVAHLNDVQNCLRLIEDAGLKLNSKKCFIGKSCVSVLGFKVDAEGVHIDEKNIERIRSINSPTNVSELRSIVGLVSYFRKFIRNLADISKPLYELC